MAADRLGSLLIDSYREKVFLRLTKLEWVKRLDAAAEVLEFVQHCTDAAARPAPACCGCVRCRALTAGAEPARRSSRAIYPGARVHIPESTDCEPPRRGYHPSQGGRRGERRGERRDNSTLLERVLLSGGSVPPFANGRVVGRVLELQAELERLTLTLTLTLALALTLILTQAATAPAQNATTTVPAGFTGEPAAQDPDEWW